jgi:hypothetical protein
MGSGQLTPQQADAKLTSMGATEVNPGSGVWTTPQGETLDLQIARKAALANGGTITPGWTSTGASAIGAGGVAPTSGAPTNSMAPTGAAAGAGTGSIGGAGGSGPIWDFLMNQMNQSKQVNRKDPIIANQVNAFDAAQTRASRNYLDQLAEQGGPNANLGMETRMDAEKRGQASGGFQAQLMQQELTARRQEIQQALSGTLGWLSDDKKLALQKELAQMDNALQYSQLGQNAYQFDVNDEFRRSPLAS